MNPSSVCILGGAGWVGRHIAARLMSDGRRVRVLSRSPIRARHILVLPTAEVIDPGAYDARSLARALDGFEAVINLAGILHERTPGDFDRTHVDLPRAVVAAMKESGIRRLLHMSAFGAEVRGPSRYLQTKGEGENIVMRAQRESVLDVTVFRPSVIFGVGDNFLNLFARLVRTFPVVPLARADWRVQPVWVGDVARAFTTSLDTPATVGQRYNLCGPRIYTLADIVRLAARAQQLSRAIIPLPLGAARFQAWILEHLPGPLMTRDNLRSLSLDSVCDAPFPAVFGTAAPLEAILPDYIRPRDADRHATHREQAGR